MEVKARASLHQFKECLKKISQRHPKSPVKKPMTSEKKSSPKRAVVSSPKIKKKSTSFSTKESQTAKSSLRAVEFKSDDLIGKPPDVGNGAHPQENTRISSVVRDTKYFSYNPSQHVTENASNEKKCRTKSGSIHKAG